MNKVDEYCLSRYHDLGMLEDNKNIRLKRRISDGKICVEKHRSQDMVYIYRFLKEHYNLHVPEVFECVENDTEIIVIEEYIEGKTIEQIVHERKIEGKEAAGIIDELCKGLAFLHHAQPPIICRDLKAENIIIGNQGCIKIVDFNIARFYQKNKKHDTVFMGTAGYAAPEQFGFFQTDNRADIYSLGVLLNYMLTKQFPADCIADGKLRPIIRKCVHIDREQRYQCVEELQTDLYKLYSLGKKHSCGKGNSRNRKAALSEYIPPGFRSGKPAHMILSIIGYIFIGWFCFSLELKQENQILSGVRLRFEQTSIFISQIIMILIIWNYRGWKNYIPVVSSKKTGIRITGYIILEFVLIVIAALISVVLGSLLF